MDREILKSGLIEYGYELSENEEDSFETFSRLLVEWNEKMNLTAVTEAKEISIKHFLDSIVPVFSFDIKENSKIIDVGTGAGFPGVPIKIIRPDLDFTFLDSLNKRINFLKEVSSNLNFEKSEFVHMRAEDAGKDKKFRGKYDYAVSRAVAPLKVLSEYCIPLLKIGGTFAAFKAFDIEEELNDAKSMIGNLGGKIKDIKEVKIPHSDIVRKIVLIEKIKETQKEFPRKANKIK
ncbi:MAG: 16S rRNA (guanine(527)-N(7))-methyltransferase RsmG [Ruminococcaceae bacterium]|nr:16S rRNA (guanine(527)-N(7))-methyltransferase RsmG [Oscillospiraceae bacterium]